MASRSGRSWHQPDDLVARKGRALGFPIGAAGFEPATFGPPSHPSSQIREKSLEIRDFRESAAFPAGSLYSNGRPDVAGLPSEHGASGVSQESSAQPFVCVPWSVKLSAAPVTPLKWTTTWPDVKTSPGSPVFAWPMGPKKLNEWPWPS